MDWARAKNILIVLLLVLNATLTAVIVDRMTGGDADRAFYASVTRILDDRGVAMHCDFPRQVTDSGLLMYGDGAKFVENCARALSNNGNNTARIEMAGRESLRYTNELADENLSTASISALDTAIRRKFAEWNIDMSVFITDATIIDAGGNYYYHYILDYQGNPVFDSNISVAVDKEGSVREISINYREIKSASAEKLMKVIPAYQVVLKNFYDAGAAITSINIGFMGQNTARDNPFIESEEGAVWRVKLDDGTERFFEATYGDEIIKTTLT